MITEISFTTRYVNAQGLDQLLCIRGDDVQEVLTTAAEAISHLGIERVHIAAEQPKDSGPECPVHHKAAHGRFGLYCPTRQPDGQWCTWEAQEERRQARLARQGGLGASAPGPPPFSAHRLSTGSLRTRNATTTPTTTPPEHHTTAHPAPQPTRYMFSRGTFAHPTRCRMFSGSHTSRRHEEHYRTPCQAGQGPRASQGHSGRPSREAPSARHTA